MQKMIEQLRWPLETPLKDKWRPSRLIIYNYWLWDEVEFYFVNGILYFNGPNASGKSNALAAAIPLCLDGQKDRSRLDTFGSDDKRIQDYIIGPVNAIKDNPLYHEERTSYIAIEFMKNLSTYITIGIGLKTSRQRQGQEVDFWGFLLDGNRRIGQNFNLYDSKRYPLSYQQLKAEIGDPSKVTKKVSEYKAMVNQALFGYESIDQYEELMYLLLRLRSPQLSSKLRPSTVSKTLCMSLPPVESSIISYIHEILRSIDEFYDTLQQREQQESVANQWEKLENSIARYKAQYEALHTNRQLELLREKENEIERLETDAGEKSRELEQLKQKKKSLDEEEIKIKSQLEIYKNSGLMAQAEQKEILKQDLEDAKVELERKQDRSRELKQKMKELTDSYAKAEIDWGHMGDSILQKIEELAILVNDWRWSDGFNLMNSLRTRLKGIKLTDEVDWDAERSHFLNLSKAWRDVYERIKSVISQWNAWQTVNIIYQQEKLLAEKKKEELRNADSTLSQAKENFDKAYNDVKAFLQEWLENKHVNIWDKTELLIPESIRTEILSAVPIEPSDFSSFEKILDPAAEELNNCRVKLQREIAFQKSRVGRVEEESQQIQKALNQLINQKEVEPKRSNSHTLAREELRKADIPFRPMYSVCRPREEINLENATRMETHLEEMGLLDALIVPESWQEEVRLLLEKSGLGEAWIKPAPHPEKVATLWDCLEPDHHGWEGEIEKTLRSIRIDGVGQVSLKDDGSWCHGILRGTAEFRKDVLYLGAEARERRRQYEINNLREKLASALRIVEEEKANLKALEDELNSIVIWWDKRKEEDSFFSYEQALRLLQRCQNEVIRCSKNLDDANKSLERISQKRTRNK